MQYVGKLGLLVAVCLWATVANAADTLVVKGSDGKVGPGAAASWKTSGTTVVFTLVEGTDGAAWAQALSERLAGATAVFEGGKLKVTGIPSSTLLDQLSAVNLAGDADPLAELAGLGGGEAAMDGPEGGGSIRASKPTAVAMGPRAIRGHDANARFEADVVAVKYGAFPQVSLKLKMRKGGRSSPLRKQLYYGKIIDAVVVYNINSSVVDLGDQANRRNLAAWYLKKGDRIQMHPVAAGANFEIDWLTRK
jgi:hypothetical protein